MPVEPATLPPREPAAPEPPKPAFRPLLEVSAFQRPRDCDRLDAAAGEQLDTLARQIEEQARRGLKRLGVAACRRGDGCTTLVLALAPRLIAAGLRVLLVDADFYNPLLGRRLGLLPEAGWEEVLAGRTAAEDVVVESLADRLCIMPLCEPATGRAYDLGPQPDPGATLRSLSEHYDLLLIDLGRFSRHEVNGGTLPRPGSDWIDGLVLIHNVRSTPPEDLLRNRRRVQDAGIRELGVVENFVS